ncbi:MAG: GNAT family N-acetyltransferase [Pseudomonadota bacterium]
MTAMTSEHARVVVQIAISDAEIAHCLAVRRAVYIDGMGISEADEVDGFDPESTHFLATMNDQPVGAARLRIVDGAAKVQRVAVLLEARGCGIGSKIVEAMIAHVRDTAISDTIKLSAQTRAFTLYERLGFHPVGKIFDDVGLPHQDMVLSLAKA